MHFGIFEFCVHPLSVFKGMIFFLILGKKSKEIVEEPLECEYNSRIASKGTDLLLCEMICS